MSIHPSVLEALAPTGKLRASINLGNPILAGRDTLGQPTGVSVDLAHELARRLGTPLELIVFDAAGKSVTAVTQEVADVGFFAIDPLRGRGLHFTGPYILIEGCYLVRDESPLTDPAQVDRPGITVMVGKGSAYDLYLTRVLKQAAIVRASTSPAVVDEFLAQCTQVAAGVRQQLEADAQRLPGLRLLPGHFMVIEQAMGMPISRHPSGVAYLRQFVEDMKRCGFVAEALHRHGVHGAQVAPAEPA